MCWAYQALAGMFHSQPLPPKMFWLVRAVQPRVCWPKALRVAMRHGSAQAVTKSKSGSWHSGRAVDSAPQ